MNTITWTLGSSDDSPRAFFGLSKLEWNSVVGAVATAACVGSHSTTAVLVDTAGNERRVRAVRQHGASWRLEEVGTPDATVNIVAVEPRAVQVRASDLQVGDAVFDVHGGKHPLTHVRHRANITEFKRDDYPWDYLRNDQTITVIRKEG